MNSFLFLCQAYLLFFFFVELFLIFYIHKGCNKIVIVITNVQKCFIEK